MYRLWSPALDARLRRQPPPVATLCAVEELEVDIGNKDVDPRQDNQHRRGDAPHRLRQAAHLNG
eukprot:scaffold181576_cov39-Prasinocladus_malaysianus.AAC.2